MRENYLQIYGKTPIEHPIDEKNDCSAAFMLLRCKNIARDVDGEKITYKMLNLGEVVIKQGDTIIKGEPDKFKQKLRGVMWFIYSEAGLTEDFEIWRDKLKKKIIAYMPEIYEYLKKRT